MPKREHFINKIREIGFSYKTQAKRRSIWKRGEEVLMLPSWKELPEDYCRIELEMRGVSNKEIEEFIRSSK